MPAGEPVRHEVDDLVREGGQVVGGRQELVGRRRAVRAVDADAREVLDDALILRAGDADDESGRRGRLAQAVEIDVAQIGARLPRQEEAERLVSVRPGARTGREGLWLEHPVHLVGAGGVGDEGGAARVRAPEHQAVDVSPLRRDHGGQGGAEAQPDQRDGADPLRTRSASTAAPMSRRQAAARPGARSSAAESPVPWKSKRSTSKPAAASRSARWRRGLWARTMSSPTGLHRTTPAPARAPPQRDTSRRAARRRNKAAWHPAPRRPPRAAPARRRRALRPTAGSARPARRPCCRSASRRFRP